MGIEEKMALRSWRLEPDNGYEPKTASGKEWKMKWETFWNDRAKWEDLRDREHVRQWPLWWAKDMLTLIEEEAA